MGRVWGLLLVACASTAQPPAPENPAVPAAPLTLLRGGTLMTAAGPTLEGADLLIRGSRIEALGTGLAAPSGARVIDLEGRFVTPGLIDPHSHLGVYPSPRTRAHADGNEATDPFTPEVRAEESFWPQDPGLRRAVAGGVTSLHVLPGSANLVGGQGFTLKLRPALSAAGMRLDGAPATMKLACGENPKRVYGQGRKRAPATRMGEIALLRSKLEKARAWAADPDHQLADEDSDQATGKEARDFGLAALAGTLEGRVLIQNHCYRADEMLLRLSLFGEFDTQPRAFHHAVEAYKIRDQLAAADVGAVVWVDWWGSKLEMLDSVPANAALLDAAGVRVALHSDSAYDVQHLNQEAAKAMAAGRRAGLEVEPEDAIRWVTAHPAWILGIDDRTGTLEAGKDADVVVWSGTPFSVYAHADLVFIDGRLVYDRARPGSYRVSDFELGTRSAP